MMFYVIGLSNFIGGAIYYLDINGYYNIDINMYYIPIIVFGIGGSLFNFFLTVFSYIGDLANLRPDQRQGN